MTEKLHFLGIGAQKSATSWLWQALKDHPDIWMPYRKEIHYFDRDLLYASPSYLASDTLRERLWSREPHKKRFRENMLRDFQRAASQRDIQCLRWNLKFYLSTYSDNWYLSLFSDSDSKIKGEITPAYSILNSQDVERISKILPHLKIIYILRNPIYRAWSQIRFDCFTHKYSSISSLEDIDAIKEYIDSDVQSLRSDYIKTLDTWGRIQEMWEDLPIRKKG